MDSFDIVCFMFVVSAAMNVWQYLHLIHVKKVFLKVYELTAEADIAEAAKKN